MDAAGVVPAVRDADLLHPAWLAVGEPLRRESFNGRVRDELLNVEELTSLTVAQVVIEAWRIEYNTYRPHSALDGLTPAEYAATWTAPPHPHAHSEWTNNRGPVRPPPHPRPTWRAPGTPSSRSAQQTDCAGWPRLHTAG